MWNTSSSDSHQKVVYPKFPNSLVCEKSQLIEDVIWVDLGIIELTSTRYRHGIENT